MFAWIKKFIHFLTFLPVNLAKLTYENYKEFKEFTFYSFDHFKNLREKNIDLGKFHIKQGNFRDAKLRFWIINKLIAPNDPENLYWSSWCDILTGNYENAIDKLKNNEFDNIGARDYLLSMESAKIIPEEIYKTAESLLEITKYDKYYTEKKNLYDEYKTLLLENLPEDPLEETGEKYSILEIGTNPVFMSEILKFLPDPCTIDGINYLKQRSLEAKEVNSEIKIYREIITQKRNNIERLENNIKYNLVSSFDGLTYTSELTEIFVNIKNFLVEDGIFIFSAPKGKVTELDPSSNRFIYTKKDIEEKLTLAGFETISITVANIEQNNNYYLVMAK